MKKLLILLFSLLISFNSYGKWTEISENINDTSFYLDKNTIIEVGEYVYLWTMTDLLEPNKFGDRSVKVYEQLDCELNQYKRLVYVFYSQPMGIGGSETEIGEGKWQHMEPDTSSYELWRYACDYVK